MEANEESYAGLLHCTIIITKHFLYNVITDETQSLNHIIASLLQYTFGAELCDSNIFI